uniref:Death domain-containing protein n=1 Tax=Branchiostoma floridae TaxID=7739 RepID=C3ZU27_BRAFL|eukprot:XP_002587902.1 hypothetical protein BRAFLDRAFT_87290 [Branchiostoma floridae]
MADPVRERVTAADRRQFDFVQTLLRISKELTEEETAIMKLCCLHLIPKRQATQLKRAVDVFHKLMELDKIDQENLEFMEEILERIGRQDLIRDVLRPFQPPNREIPENPELQPEKPDLQPEYPEHPPENLEVQPTDPELQSENPELQPENPEIQSENPELQSGTSLEGTTADAWWEVVPGDVLGHFDDVIQEVSHKWDDLARELGFQHNEIKVIRDLERDHDRRCREMLTRWRNREGRGATLQVLNQALMNIGETRTAESLEGNATSNIYVVLHGAMIQETLDHLKNCLATLCGATRSQIKFIGHKKHKSILVHFSIPRENTAVLRHMADHSDPRLVYMGVKSLQIDADVPIKVQQGAPVYGVNRQLSVDDIEVGCSTRTRHQKAPQSWTRLSALNLFSDALPLHLQAAASLEYQGFSYSLVRALVQKDRLREHQMRQAIQNLRNAEVDSNTLRQKAEVDFNTLRQKAEVDSNTIMTLRSKLNIAENRLQEALETITVLEEKLRQAQEYAEKAAKQVTSHVTEYKGEKPPGGWPQEYRGEKPPGGWSQEYRGEKPPGGWSQEYRGEKPPGETLQGYRGEKPHRGWSAQVEKADAATETHLAGPVDTTGRPGDKGDKLGEDPTAKEEGKTVAMQDSDSESDRRVEILCTEAPEQERHTAEIDLEGVAHGSTGNLKQRVITFGGEGTEPGKFQFPRGVVVSPSNEIFVTDKNNGQVQVHSTEGVYLRHFPTRGTVITTHDVCMDGNGTLWVVGRGGTADHVVQYSTDGTAMAGFELKMSNDTRGIAVDMRTNHILVSDPDQGEVLVFRPDGSLVRTVQHPRGEMTHPRYITVDGEGNIVVSDWVTYCVYVYDESGKFLFQFGVNRPETLIPVVPIVSARCGAAPAIPTLPSGHDQSLTGTELVSNCHIYCNLFQCPDRMAGPAREIEGFTDEDRRHFEFVRPLIHISDSLTKKETDDVKIYCAHVIPKGMIKGLKRAVDIFLKLKEIGKINQENLDFVEEVLEMIGRRDLARDVLRPAEQPDRAVPENPELQPEIPEPQPENPEPLPEPSHDEARAEEPATSNIYTVVHGHSSMTQETVDRHRQNIASACNTRRSQVKFRGYKKHKSILVHFSIPRENTAVLRHMADHSDPRLVYMGVESLQIDAEVPIKVQQEAPLYDIKRQIPVDDIEVGCSTRTKHKKAPQSWTRLSALNLFSDALPLHLQAAATLEYQGFSYSLVRALVQKDRLREHQMRQAIQNLRNAEVDFNTLRQKAEVDSNTLRQKAEVDSNTIMTLRSKLNIAENRLKEALETIAVLEEKLQQAQEHSEKAAKQLASNVTEHRGEKPPGGWPREYRGEKPPGGWPQEYRGEKPPGGWSSQVEKADSATQTHLTDLFGTTGRPGDVGGDKVGADPTVKEEDGKTPRQDSGSESDGRVEVLGTEAHEQERHTAGIEGAAHGSTGEVNKGVITFGVVPGTGDKVMKPHDVCMDGNGTLWLLGRGEKPNHIVLYSTDGTAMAGFDLKKSIYFRGIAVDMRTNHILVTDADQDEVQVFRPDGSLVRAVRHPRGEMTRPRYITVDGEGNILVSDWDSNFVYVYDASGKFLFQFKGYGSGEGQLKRPTGICTDSLGEIIVADSGNQRVQIFTRHGEFVRTVRTGFKPEGLAVGPEGQLVVTDWYKDTVTVFPNY